MSAQKEFSILVDGTESGTRMDVFIASHISDCSRALAAELIRQGVIRVQGTIKKPGYRLKAGDAVQGIIPEPEPVVFQPEPIPLDILHEDREIIVINKSPGLVVHPAPGHYTGTLVNGLLHHCPELEGIGGRIRPGIVHRLDKDTSGTLVIAKNLSAQHHLAMQFKSRTIQKEYLAVVHGEMTADRGVIVLPVGRHPTDRKKMSIRSRTGRAAETCWKVRERLNHATWIEVRLKTGRTHQIRVHCSAIHHPILGDDTYGGSRLDKRLPVSPRRQLLHAWRLGLIHPGSGEYCEFESPIPDDMQQAVEVLRQ